MEEMRKAMGKMMQAQSKLQEEVIEVHRRSALSKIRRRTSRTSKGASGVQGFDHRSKLAQAGF